MVSGNRLHPRPERLRRPKLIELQIRFHERLEHQVFRVIVIPGESATDCPNVTFKRLHQRRERITVPLSCAQHEVSTRRRDLHLTQRS